ncbi:diaminopimelate decarboxylase [Candidatus Woesearchaeota archaeon]|nr:diaminopimelate decarboxylase [Candidatus Woesearchaeota archaeon]
MERQIGGISAVTLAKEFGTPLYVYDKQIILQRINDLKEAFPQAHICYAIKANPNLSILKLIAQQGLGVDCSNRFELELAEKAGFDLKRSVFTSTNPSDEDLKKALSTGILMNLDHISIFRRLQKIGLPKKISFRINPGFGNGKFPEIDVGGKDAKFGMSEELATECYKLAKESGVQHFGIHMMTGSCILDEAYFEKLILTIETIAESIEKKVGITFEWMDIGGGIGVPYEPFEKPLNLKAVGERIQRVKKSPATLVLEPGRYIVAQSGTLLTKVTTIKEKFIGVDAGMTTLIRPMLYGAYHPIVLANDDALPETEKYTVVGPICESTDCFAKDRSLPKIKEGDILAIQIVGAYGFIMGSQYNGQPRAAEILVSNGLYSLIRKRETTEDLIRNETY